MYNNLRIGNPARRYGILPILWRALLLYIGRMETFEIIWRGAILLILGFLAWNYIVGGGLVVGALLMLCIPVWLYITLYSLNYI